MNERIKELMAQAVTFRLDPDSNAHEAQVSPEDIELFAELIIKECIHVVENGGGMCGATSSNKIKEYFGVE